MIILDPALQMDRFDTTDSRNTQLFANFLPSGPLNLYSFYGLNRNGYRIQEDTYALGGYSGNRHGTSALEKGLNFMPLQVITVAGSLLWIYSLEKENTQDDASMYRNDYASAFITDDALYVFNYVYKCLSRAGYCFF